MVSNDKWRESPPALTPAYSSEDEWEKNRSLRTLFFICTVVLVVLLFCSPELLAK